MDERLVEQIRRDLDAVFPDGGYSLTVQPGQPPLRLTWDDSVDDSTRRRSEEILRLHNVAFATDGDPAARQRALRITATGAASGRASADDR